MLLERASGAMAAKIFINYRRDDDPNGAARVRDGLAARFGKASVFMDVDNLMAGQRFDEELAKALSQCDVLIAVMGPRWLELLKARAASGERDYVREEIAEALNRKLTVIPVRVGREGSMPALPRRDELPEDIRDLVLYQKHDVAHERFGRDIAELIEAVTTIRRTRRPQYAAPRVPWTWVAATALAVLGLGAAGAHFSGVHMPWTSTATVDPAVVAREQSRAADLAAEVKREQEARAKAEAEAKRLADLAAQERREREARENAAADAVARAKAAEDQRQKDAAEAKRKAEEEARRVPQPGQSFRDCNDGCPEMVVLPAGSFTMGSPANEAGREGDEGPQRTVTIAKPFAVGKFEVTFADWDACVAGGGCQSNKSPDDRGWGKGQRPVINVSWDDAKQYVAWLSRKTGKPYRLLSEAEWEYAARGKSQTRFSFGNDDAQLGAHAWLTTNSGGKTQPVGGKTANAVGLHDMHGNVLEWVEDCWHDSYSGAPSDGSAWTTACTESRHRVVRGGSWYGLPVDLRSAFRGWNPSVLRNLNLGFRVGRTLTP